MTFQAKLTTKLDAFSVDDTVIELKNSIDSVQLNAIVKDLLTQLDKVEDAKQLKTIKFDFVVGGRLLRLPVHEHLSSYSDEIDAGEVLAEKLVDVEYFISHQAPKPLEAVPHEDWVSSVDANDKYIITGSYDNSIRIFSVDDRKTLATLQNAHSKSICSVRWLQPTATGSNNLPKNVYQFVSCGHDQECILHQYDAKTNKVQTLIVYKGHNRSVHCVDSHDDMLATGSYDKTIRLWSTNLNEAEATENGNDDAENQERRTRSARNSKKQKVKSSQKSVEQHTQSAVSTLTGHQDCVTDLRWLGSCNEFSSLASCSLDMTIRVWDIEIGECKRTILSSKPVLSLAYNEDKGAILTGSCDRHIRLWDARAPDNSTAKAAFTSHSGWVSRVAFSPSDANNFISGGYDNLVKLWDLRSPKASLYDLIGHHDKVLDINWSNGKYVLSGSADCTLKVFAT